MGGSALSVNGTGAMLFFGAFTVSNIQPPPFPFPWSSAKPTTA